MVHEMQVKALTGGELSPLECCCVVQHVVRFVEFPAEPGGQMAAEERRTSAESQVRWTPADDQRRDHGIPSECGREPGVARAVDGDVLHAISICRQESEGLRTAT